MPVPMAFWLPEPAPLLSASGSTPRPKAIEVMRIGRRRWRTACRAASTSVAPWSKCSVGQPGPLDAEARRQAFGHFLDLAHGFAGAVAGRGFVEDGDGRRAVEALELGRAERPGGGRERGERHHAVLRVAQIPAVYVL